MAESREVKALQTISAEVDESQIKVICSTQCIKAQAQLSYKLRKRAERLKDTYSFIIRANSKLQSEITQAQEGIKSLLIAQENMTMANVELKKELLLAKEKKVEVLERVKNGEKKYENIWLESKGRIESLTFVQRLLKTKDEVKILEQEMNKLENDKKIFIEKIEAKTKICIQLDRKRIIELAEFIVHEIPTNLKIIMEKSAAISDLTIELNSLELKSKQSKNIVKKSVTPHITKDDSKKGNMTLSESDNYNSSTMPNLQLGHFSFDALTIKLDEAKIKANKTPTKNKIDLTSYMEVDPSKANKKIDNTEGYNSFYNMPSAVYEYNEPKNYATKKLINILEDIKINTSQAQNMMAKVNPDTLLPVDSISRNDKNNEAGAVLKNKVNKPIVSEEIEEIDMTNSNKAPILIPPTQFLDISLEQEFQKEPQLKSFNFEAVTKSKDMENLSQNQTFQEGLSKKKVSFNLSNALEMNVSDGDDNYATNTPTENNVNETLSSQLDVSAVSDDGFSKMQDIIMKKHHLDLSPQFVYAKNTITPLNLQQTEDVVTSKFFQDKSLPAEPQREDQITIDNKKSMEGNKIDDKPKEYQNNILYKSDDKTKETDNDIKTKQDDRPIVNNNFDADSVSNPKRRKVNEMIKVDKPARGYLLSQDDAPMSKSLDVSMNATGFEDGDEDYPGCIDSSLLLSPKADIPMSMTAGENVVSQDVPNFLSGLRKTGLSIFGQLPSSEPRPGSSAPNQGGGSSTGFSFSFGGADKKSRGGLFSMFQ